MKIDLSTLNPAHYAPWFAGTRIPPEKARIDVAVRPVGARETREHLTFEVWLESHLTFQIHQKGSRVLLPVYLKTLGGKPDSILEAKLKTLFEESWISLRK